MTKMNERAWNSERHGKKLTEDQHKKGKKWYVTHAPMRTKWHWNKKKSILERTKKGSRQFYYWSD